MLHGRTSLLLVGFFLLFIQGPVQWSPAAELRWEPAPRADDFVDSIGVCTHWGYLDTPYGKNYALAKQRLAESGIRHVRDGLGPRNAELFHELGVRSTVIAEPHQKPLDQQLAAWKSEPGMFATIEGPNEPNNFWPRFNVAYKGKGWPEGLRLWQDDLYKAVRAEPALANVTVSSPTPIFDGPFEAAPITSFDLLAFHPYAGGSMPSMSIPWTGSTVHKAIGLLGHNAQMKPLIATESGYHNSVSDKVIAGNQSGISQTAGGRYFPRHFAEYWNAGFVRTFTYEFIDEFDKPLDPEANFGLLRHDLSPKPAFMALANMISILSESHWDSGKRAWDRPAAPARAVQIAIDAPPQVHHAALSRADGSIDLLLWLEVPSFDLKTGKDLSPAAVPVKVTVAAPVAAALYHPLLGTNVQQRFDANTSFEMKIPDEVIILRLSAAPPQGAVLAAPADVAVTPAATSATFKWHGSAPAYVIHRLGRYVGTASPGADGSVSFTDNQLLPGLGFSYTICAVGPDGLLSAPTTVIARTPNQRPDLVVESIAWDPPHPQPGDSVHFVVTIANIGNAPTSAVTHGVAMEVDGKVVCWSDTSHDPLAPGERRTVTTNNGPIGKATWACTPGTFYIKATVDDQNRIDESNKQNNSRREVLSTGVGCDLVVTSVRAEGPVKTGKPVMLIGTIKNIGSAPTPQGGWISCTFLSEEAGGKTKTLGYGGSGHVLTPGESADIKMEQPWTPSQPAEYHIVGVVDDVDRIAELNKKNNRSEPLTFHAQ
jgi:hypothetical protein